MKALLRLLVVALPWPIKRRVLGWLYGYELNPSSHIGWAWVYPQRLVMRSHSRIGTLTVCRGLELLELGEHATIGRLNWISGYPANQAPHFAHMTTRHPRLIVGDHAAITHRHIIDCTDQVSLGAFTTVAGFRSQILTHSIDLNLCRQDAGPITIGSYCFIGTGCTLLGGAKVPDYSVVGAGALLNQSYDQSYRLYAGVPAKAVAELSPDMTYFHRPQGFVV